MHQQHPRNAHDFFAFDRNLAGLLSHCPPLHSLTHTYVVVARGSRDSRCSERSSLMSDRRPHQRIQRMGGQNSSPLIAPGSYMRKERGRRRRNSSSSNSSTLVNVTALRSDTATEIELVPGATCILPPASSAQVPALYHAIGVSGDTSGVSATTSIGTVVHSQLRTRLSGRSLPHDATNI